MTLRLGLIGFPIHHSLSPAMQQPALDALGIDATYELWPTPLDDLESRIGSLRAEDVLGANVTVPHKQAVIPFVDELSEVATAARAVNTIVHRGGELFGDNTDVYGLATSVREAGVSSTGFNAVLLGAGGAARGALVALQSLGASHITLANRTHEHATELAQSFPDAAIDVTGVAGERLNEAVRIADVIVNATALGWNAGEMPVEASLLAELPASALVVDLTYRDTPLLEAAAGLGLRTLDGLPMLVYQGARSLELWTGREAPVQLMMERALEARSARS